MEETSERIIVYTNIYADNLNPEEKKAFVSLKKRFGYFHYGRKDDYIAIVFDITQVSEITHDKGSQSIWKREVIPNP